MSRIRQFGEITKQSGYRESARRTVDYFGNRLVRLVTGLYLSDQANQPTNYEKVLFIEAVGKHDGSGIGDGIFRLPAIESLAHVFPECHTLTREFRTILHEGNPGIQKVHSVPGERSWGDLIRLVYKLRAENFSHILTIDPSWRMFLFLLATKKKAQLLLGQISEEELLSNNLIALFHQKVSDLLCLENEVTTPHLYPSPLPEEIKSKFTSGVKYIGINLGARSGLRHFKDWEEIFRRLKAKHPIPLDTRFVLVGREGVDDLDARITEIMGTNMVLNFCNAISLRETYGVIAKCNGGFIGMDGGNANAAIGMQHLTHARVIPIYNVVEGAKRLPAGYRSADYIDLPCPDIKGRCFGQNGGRYCTVTGQFEQDAKTPPCLKGEGAAEIIYNKLVSLVE